MHKPSRFKGTGVAIITPFHADLSVDFPALAALIDFQIEGGVDFIVSLGTTGEYATLNEQEALEVLRFTAEKINGRRPLVAGCFGGSDTAQLVQNIKQFNFTGIDAIMSSNPSYVKPTQDGIFQHYMAIEAASPVPIIIYNVPSRTSSNVTPDTIVRLAKASKKFIAVKEASGSNQQVTEIINQRPDGFLVLCGDDPSILPAISLGADGGISVIANALPVQFSALIKAARENDWQTARKINANLWDIHKWLYCEGNPTGIKAAVEIKGLASKVVRLPLVSLSDEPYKNLEQLMQTL